MDRIQTAESVTPAKQRVYLRLASSSDEQTLMQLKQAIDANSGDMEVILVLGENASRQAIKLPGGVVREDSVMGHLKELVGADNFKLQ